MIAWVKNFIALHPELAPLAISLSLMLAGCNVPLSADLVILIAATLAATVMPESLIPLYLAVFAGSIVAAYLAYAQGRFLGSYLLKKPFFQKLFPPSRLEKIKTHYQKHSWATLIIGRFIPFGFRNALFISTGLAKCPFKKVALQDFIACLIWSLTLFTSFYQLILKVDDLIPLIKKFNLIVLAILGLSIITIIWYKHAKRRRLAH